MAPWDESGTVLPGVVWLLLFAAGVFAFLVYVLHWVGQQVPNV